MIVEERNLSSIEKPFGEVNDNDGYAPMDKRMKNGVAERPTAPVAAERGLADKPLHPAWRAFIRYCAELGHGEIGSLKIQDGLPVIAEKIKQKVKFS